MTIQPYPKTRRKQLRVLAGLTLPLFAVAGIWLLRSPTADVPAALIKAGFVVIILIPMIVMGVLSWMSRKDLDELSLRIQNDAALIVQNVTATLLAILILGQLAFKDAFPMPEVPDLAFAYVWLLLGAQWLAKRRYA